MKELGMGIHFLLLLAMFVALVYGHILEGIILFVMISINGYVFIKKMEGQNAKGTKVM